MFTMHATNMQLWMVLDGFHWPTSAWPETGWTNSIDLSLNIDVESRSGASAVGTQVCCKCAPEATVSDVTTKGR